MNYDAAPPANSGTEGGEGGDAAGENVAEVSARDQSVVDDGTGNGVVISELHSSAGL